MEYLEDRIGGAYVLNVGIRHFMVTPEYWERIHRNPRIGLPSRSLDDELAQRGLAPARPTGDYFLDQYKFLSSRLLPSVEHLLLGPPTPKRYLDLAHATDEEMDKKLDAYLALQNTFARIYHEYHEENFAVLERIIAGIRSASPGARIVLLEGVWDVRFLAKVKQERYQVAIVEFAERLGVEHWDLSTEVNLDRSAFYSLAHIGDPAARVEFARVMTRRLAELLGSSPEPESSAPRKDDS